MEEQNIESRVYDGKKLRILGLFEEKICYISQDNKRIGNLKMYTPSDGKENGLNQIFHENMKESTNLMAIETTNGA